MTLPMTFVEFESQVRNVRQDPQMSPWTKLLYDANAMQSEAGEAGDAVKKYIRDGMGTETLDEALLEECGDTLFYMRRLLQSRNLRIEDAAHALLRKLDRMEAEAAAAEGHRPADCPVCQKRICRRAGG